LHQYGGGKIMTDFRTSVDHIATAIILTGRAYAEKDIEKSAELINESEFELNQEEVES
jgi:hypothetical protein